MTIDLDALERIAQAATPGPWDHQPYGEQNQNGDYFGGDVFDGNGEYLLSEVADVDGAHIAAFDPPAALALITRVRELEAIVNDGGNQAAKYWTRLAEAEREMHARELHHFEEEKLRAEAEAERDRYRNAIEAATAVPNEFEWDVPPTAKHILTRALNDKEAD